MDLLVHAPCGWHTIKNPLFGYRFNPVYSDFGDKSEDVNGVNDEHTVRLFLLKVSEENTLI